MQQLYSIRFKYRLNDLICSDRQDINKKERGSALIGGQGRYHRLLAHLIILVFKSEEGNLNDPLGVFWQLNPGYFLLPYSFV